MKPLKSLSVLGLALILGAGCQETTSTGPATKTDSKGRPETKKLSVIAAKNQTIERGKTDKVEVTINRDNFDDPVTIRLNDLPPGVEVVEAMAVIPSGKNMATLTLKANEDAAVGEHKVTIAANAPGLDENLQTFNLTVKDGRS